MVSMGTERKTKVFLDSSVVIAGLASTRGASCLVLSLAEIGVFEPYVSEQVVTEVVRNVENKLPSCLPQFFALFKALPLRMAEPSQRELARARRLINEKDAPLLAAALTAGVDVFLSLDKHFLTAEIRHALPILFCTPAEFLASAVP